jgi:hypothetical protein
MYTAAQILEPGTSRRLKVSFKSRSPLKHFALGKARTTDKVLNG